MARPIKNIAKQGEKFGRWTVLGFSHWKGHVQHWLVKCACGVEKTVVAGKLVRGETSSCRSCARKTHGVSHTKIWDAYGHAMNRCYSKKNKSYDSYGGRGIRVEWKDFNDFLKDMYVSYVEHIKIFGEKNTTLDRIDVNGNYSKENCRWATYKEQANNKTTNHRIFAFGKEQTLTQWADEFGMTNKRLWARLYREKLPIEEALTKELRIW